MVIDIESKVWNILDFNCMNINDCRKYNRSFIIIEVELCILNGNILFYQRIYIQDDSIRKYHHRHILNSSRLRLFVAYEIQVKLPSPIDRKTVETNFKMDDRVIWQDLTSYMNQSISVKTKPNSNCYVCTQKFIINISSETCQKKSNLVEFMTTNII